MAKSTRKPRGSRSKSLARRAKQRRANPISISVRIGALGALVRGPAGVPELCRRIGNSTFIDNRRNNILRGVQDLVAGKLADDSKLAETAREQGGGRPAKLYSLTRKGSGVAARVLEEINSLFAADSAADRSAVTYTSGPEPLSQALAAFEGFLERGLAGYEGDFVDGVLRIMRAYHGWLVRYPEVLAELGAVLDESNTMAEDAQKGAVRLLLRFYERFRDYWRLPEHLQNANGWEIGCRISRGILGMLLADQVWDRSRLAERTMTWQECLEAALIATVKLERLPEVLEQASGLGHSEKVPFLSLTRAKAA